MKDVTIDGRQIGPDHPPYIIAELSANHNGSIERALETMDEAKRRGASAVLQYRWEVVVSSGVFDIGMFGNFGVRRGQVFRAQSVNVVVPGNPGEDL